MQFSLSVEYALHGLVYLGLKSNGTGVLLAEIARAIHVPESYLRKIFQTLVKRNIVISQRGLQGGYALSRDLKDININDIVEAIDGASKEFYCLRLSRNCRISKNCPIKKVVSNVTKSVEKILKSTSLKTIVDEIKCNKKGWLKDMAI